MTQVLPPKESATSSRFAFLLRVAVFALMAILGMTIFPVLMMPVAGYFVTAALGTFAAAAVANALAMRIYEDGRLAGLGLGWSAASRRNLLLGIGGGIAAAALVVLLPLSTGEGAYDRVGDGRLHWASVLFVSIVLLFGAVGEELLFRGYAFQVMARHMGRYATIIPMAVLFGVAHLNNQNVSAVGLANTVAWGLLLGVAFFRSGDLWLPIGLHFGWNWTLPMLGVNLSGFTMEVTGHAVHPRVGALWSGGDYGPEGSLFTTMAVAALFVYIYKVPVLHQIPWLAGDE